MMYDEFDLMLADVAPKELMTRIESAIVALESSLSNFFLDDSLRPPLLKSLDLLTLVWSDLQQRGSEAAVFRSGQIGTLLAVISLCRMTSSCRLEEMSVVVRALERLMAGWTAVQKEPAPTAPDTPAEPQNAEEHDNTLVDSPEEAPPPAPEPQPSPNTSEQKEEQPVPAAESPLKEHTAPPQVKTAPSEERFALSERLDALSKQIDHIQNHRLSEEETVALLLACTCQYRLLLPHAKSDGRDWEVESIWRQLYHLIRSRWEKWRPPLTYDNVALSEHELETLHTGYESLARSWQMWRWYEKEGGVLEKGTAVPLLESIAAPIPMIHQIWNAKQLREAVMERDTTERLSRLVQDAAAARKWNVEMLARNSTRQRQLHFIRQADTNWENARRVVAKKQQQNLALEKLRTVLSSPNHSSFEEDLLCAIVECHLAQIPYSNRELVGLVRGYHFLLENPAIPERCQLTGSSQSTARKYLVSLGKKLVEEEIKQTTKPEAPEEPLPETNGELLERARQITRGKRLLMLCFHRSPEAEQKLREGLQLEEVQWPDLHGTESLQSMEAYIRNSDITVVVVPYSRTKWKDARDIAKEYDKLFVMATKGYGLTHLAQQIVEQCAREQCATFCSMI